MSDARSDAIARPNGSPGNELLRMPAVVQRTGLGRSTIYRLMATKRFPMPVRLASRAVGWRSTDLDRWSQSLPTAAH